MEFTVNVLKKIIYVSLFIIVLIIGTCTVVVIKQKDKKEINEKINILKNEIDSIQTKKDSLLAESLQLDTLIKNHIDHNEQVTNRPSYKERKQKMSNKWNGQVESDTSSFFLNELNEIYKQKKIKTNPRQ